MKYESDVWEYIRDNLGHRCHMSRVESHETAIGIPDVDYCIRGIEGHLELKFVKSLRTKPKIRPAQWAWFRKRVREGGQPYVLVGSGDNHFYTVEGVQLLSFLNPESTAQNWVDAAHTVWHNGIDFNELMRIMAHGQEESSTQKHRETHLVTNPRLLPRTDWSD